MSKYLRFQQSVFLLPQKIKEKKGGENYYGYTKFKNMICDFEDMKSLPEKPCFQYSKILNSTEAVQFLQSDKQLIEISSNISLFGDIFSDDRMNMKAYGKF